MGVGENTFSEDVMREVSVAAPLFRRVSSGAHLTATGVSSALPTSRHKATRACECVLVFACMTVRACV
eukprot:5018493-Pleurochrysis_carterae.AAC.1